MENTCAVFTEKCAHHQVAPLLGIITIASFIFELVFCFCHCFQVFFEFVFIHCSPWSPGHSYTIRCLRVVVLEGPHNILCEMHCQLYKRLVSAIPHCQHLMALSNGVTVVAFTCRPGLSRSLHHSISDSHWQVTSSHSPGDSVSLGICGTYTCSSHPCSTISYCSIVGHIAPPAADKGSQPAPASSVLQSPKLLELGEWHVLTRVYVWWGWFNVQCLVYCHFAYILSWPMALLLSITHMPKVSLHAIEHPPCCGSISACQCKSGVCECVSDVCQKRRVRGS